jgi:hypothetical protein
MKANLISKLVELAISLALTQLDRGDVERTLLDIVRKGVQAYEDHTGQQMDPNLIRTEAPL